MKKAIWKWVIHPTETVISIPIGAEILTVQEQYGEPKLWALVDAEAKHELRYFRVYGTGHPIQENPGKYIGTFQLAKGTLVFHVFEEDKP